MSPPSAPYTANKRGRKPRLVLREQEEPGPTPETRAKLRPDRVVELHTKGLLSDAQKVAAEQIREVHDALSALWLRSPDHQQGNGSGARPRHHLDAMPPHLQKIHRRLYLPWMRAMAMERFGGLRWSEILIGVIVDCHAVEDYPDGALAVILAGLDAYG